VAAAYVIRSVVLRGGDFALDLPSDAVAAAAVIVGISAVAWARHRYGPHDVDTTSNDDECENY